MKDRGTPQWWAYIENQLDARGWSGADFQRASGLSRTRVTEWRKGASVTVDGARQVAVAFDQPLLTVLVAAGILTSDEAGLRPTAAPSPGDLTNVQLLGEVKRRLDAGDAAILASARLEAGSRR
jgi:transcriptional regulator with XRE-family HTH domain